MPRLHQYLGRKREAVHDLDHGDVIVGRAAPARIRIPDPLVSRRHARLFRRDDGWWIEDLGTRNGLYVDGRKVERAPLKEGARIVVGRHFLFYREDDAEPGLQAELEAGAAGPQDGEEKATAVMSPDKLREIQERIRDRMGAHLVWRSTDGAKTIPLRRDRLVIGYSSDCDLELPGWGLLVKRAAELLCDVEGTWIVVALHRRAGVKVGGAATEMRALAEGDTITVGKHTLVFHRSVAPG